MRKYCVRIQVIKVYDIDVVVDDLEELDGQSLEDRAVSAAYEKSTLEIAKHGHLVNVFTHNAEVIGRLQ